MVLIEIYFFLAITTALTTWWGFFRPLLNEARDKGVNNVLTESPIIASIIFITISTALAPFLISAIIFPLHGEYFRLGLQRVIEKPDE